MNEIKSFTFYKNYYDIIKYLKNEDKLIMLNAILEYMFEDKEPQLKGLNLGIWNNIKMPLNTTKTNIINGKKGGRPKTEYKTQLITQNKTEHKTELKPNIKPKYKPNNISIFLFLFSNINILNNKDYIYDLFKEYLELRKSKKYVLNETVVKRLIKKLNDYGNTDDEKIEIITNAINGAWKDFYPLEKKIIENKPNWYGKELKEEKASDNEIRKLEEALNK